MPTHWKRSLIKWEGGQMWDHMLHCLFALCKFIFRLSCQLCPRVLTLSEGDGRYQHGDRAQLNMALMWVMDFRKWFCILVSVSSFFLFPSPFALPASVSSFPFIFWRSLSQLLTHSSLTVLSSTATQHHHSQQPSSSSPPTLSSLEQRCWWSTSTTRSTMTSWHCGLATSSRTCGTLRRKAGWKET